MNARRELLMKLIEDWFELPIEVMNSDGYGRFMRTLHELPSEDALHIIDILKNRPSIVESHHSRLSALKQKADGTLTILRDNGKL